MTAHSADTTLYLHCRRLPVRFEWDEEKSKTNYRKHGVRFEEAQTAFFR